MNGTCMHACIYKIESNILVLLNLDLYAWMQRTANTEHCRRSIWAQCKIVRRRLLPPVLQIYSFLLGSRCNNELHAGRPAGRRRERYDGEDRHDWGPGQAGRMDRRQHACMCRWAVERMRLARVTRCTYVNAACAMYAWCVRGPHHLAKVPPHTTIERGPTAVGPNGTRIFVSL